jgi:prevent-host-death family protein
MGSPSAPHRHPAQNGLQLEQWKLEDAKARLSEVVRRAAEAGPQMVTVRGREAAVILTAEQYRQLAPKPKDHVPLMRFLQTLDLDQIDTEREQDLGREIAL